MACMPKRISRKMMEPLYGKQELWSTRKQHWKTKPYNLPEKETMEKIPRTFIRELIMWKRYLVQMDIVLIQKNMRLWSTGIRNRERWMISEIPRMFRMWKNHMETIRRLLAAVFMCWKQGKHWISRSRMQKVLHLHGKMLRMEQIPKTFHRTKTEVSSYGTMEMIIIFPPRKQIRSFTWTRSPVRCSQNARVWQRLILRTLIHPKSRTCQRCLPTVLH